MQQHQYFAFHIDSYSCRMDGKGCLYKVEYCYICWGHTRRARSRSLPCPHIPHGIHVESMSFQMDSTHSIWNMFWVKSQPFWLFHSIWNPLEMIWIPCGFHHSIWNFHLDAIWNHDIDSTTIPHGFHVDSIWNDGIHMDSTWIPIILTLEYR